MGYELNLVTIAAADCDSVNRSNLWRKYPNMESLRNTINGEKGRYMIVSSVYEEGLGL